MTIADLVESHRCGLTSILHAIQDLQQFHLIQYVADTHTIELTEPGSRTATAVQANTIRDSADAHLLEG
jgi:hypothetical protein